MKNNFVLTYVLFLVAQMVLGNYFHVGPYIMLTILPAMVFCIPPSVGTLGAMFIAFASGLSIDFLVEGTLGLNALSLVPVAFIRRRLIGRIFGPEPFEHKENVSIKKYGFAKTSVAIVICLLLFISIYVFMECAGTRPFLFILTRIALSVAASFFVCLVVVNNMAYDIRR